MFTAFPQSAYALEEKGRGTREKFVLYKNENKKKAAHFLIDMDPIIKSRNVSIKDQFKSSDISGNVFVL